MPESCSLCGGTFWKPVETLPGMPVKVERCECWKKRVEDHADGVPMEFHKARFANYKDLAGNRTAVKTAAEFVTGSSADLFLCGGVGCGKTRLACTIANEVNALGRSAWFVRVPMMLLKLQPPATDEDRVEAAGLARRLYTEPLLVLDDIGSERDSATDYTRRTLLMLYEERCDRGLRTVWTSNLRLSPKPGEPDLRRQPTLGEFMRDDRLASRIAGRATAIWMAAADQRVRPAREGG